ncbi:hypothetical protein A5664_18035 [Mycolicibacterium fortuitum]|uniref:hypothetical protein n=1 Tax=Mycolicibacterium fortuitum TaxID=1766 RepID=UPI0007EDF4B4|nr:hypothetical protein [Mycolicibacterium fortuitum]OBI78240.1 hypothetical protein A5664_18035 [Mycolicibacterium fortuitum]
MTTSAITDHEYHRWDNVLVLRKYELLPGMALADTSRFRDNIWSLAPAGHQMHMRMLTLSFETIPMHYRQWTKELFCTYLAMPLPAGELRLALSTVRTEFSEIKRFLTWLHDSRDAPRLSELTGADITAYAAYVRTKVSNPVSATRARAAVGRIWRYRSALPGDRLLFDPRHVDGWPERESAGRGENRTDRLPESVMGSLIVWATRFVDLFAPDILATTMEWSQLRCNHASVSTRSGQRRPVLLPDLEALLARHLAENRPIPGRKGVVNYSFLANMLNTRRSTLDRTPAYAERINAAVAVVGIDNETYFYTPIQGQLDDLPWVDKISNEYGDESLPVLTRLLQTACYILISFYSGMRDSEVKHINRGCLRIERDPEGTPYRWKIHARAFKGERDNRGVPAVWVVGEPAARAVQVLEKLQPEDTDILFQPLPYGVGWANEYRDRAMTTSTTNQWLNRFVRWVNDYCSGRNRVDGIPNIDGDPWKLKSSQFRRTLAWFIARRPGGAIAGAIAFRHQAIQMFEGYSGTSESGFRAEVESEQALVRGEELVDLADVTQHADIGGPAAEEAVRRLELFGLDADGFAGDVISDEHRLRRLMKRHDPAVYPGTYVTCVYRHDKALCRGAGNVIGLKPELAECKPLTCRNVALTAENFAAWKAEITKIDQQLAQRPKLPPLLDHHLQRRKTDIANFLGRQPHQPL